MRAALTILFGLQACNAMAQLLRSIVLQSRKLAHNLRKRSLRHSLDDLGRRLGRFLHASFRAGHGFKEGKAKTPADWVVATAAPHHATGDRNLLSGFIIEHDGQFIHAVDGIPMKVFARGAVVTDTMVLPDVWFVPGLRENLVSVSQLADLDYSVGFGFDECCIRSAANGKIMGKARLQERGQYVLDFLKVPLAI